MANGPRFRYSAWFLRNPLVSRVWRDGGRVSSEVLFPSTGGEPIAVTDRSSRDRSPSWSSDGRRLFFVSNRGGSMDLWQQRLGEEGPEGAPEPLTVGVGMRRAPFLPTGRSSLTPRAGWWETCGACPFSANVSELGGCRADHHRPGIHLGQRHLSGWPETPGELRPFRESGYLGAPRRGGRYDPVDDESHGRWAARWSPDGREIAFRSRRSGNLDLWVMPAEGGPARQLTSDPEPNYHVWWSPDGRRSPSPRTEAVTRRFG